VVEPPFGAAREYLRTRTRKVRGQRTRKPSEKSSPHGSLCGLTVRTAVSFWWARGARTPFGPAPAGANGPRPHGCELTRSEPPPLTLRVGCLDNHRDRSVLIAVRSAVAP